MNRILLFALPALSLGILQAQQAPQLSADAVREITLRNIPGTFTSGRIADVAVDPKNHNIWYVATASGGLWKTTNHGMTFAPIFDDGGSYSLGCVTIDPKNSDVVWLGTGENESQRAIGWGDGIYKSTDAGKTWKNVGLKHSEHIARILIDPRDSNVVYVASQGPLFSPGGDRGLYKTTDGGQTWKPLLQITENTGITDIAMDPRNPDVMYAAAYQRRRNTSVIVAGGPDAGIFKTTDGGKNWKKLTEGLPNVDLGRIALAISPQKPDVLYALIMTARVNKMSGYYRSEDGGEHWTRGAFKEVQDPEYYGEIFADPFQFDRVYAMDVSVFVTEDGGKTVQAAFGRGDVVMGRGGRSPYDTSAGLHSDNHALVFDPDDPNHLLEGNDGGLYESYDHGRTWRHFNNIPVTQFYRVSVDNGLPFYNVYGGTQDNGSQGVPSQTKVAAGIRTSDWMNTGGGDGYQSRADQDDASIVYTCSQQINCVRLDLKTGQSVSINPQAGRGGRGGGANGQPPAGKIADPKLRSRWDIPFIISPHNHTRLYIMANHLLQSDDSGTTWREVSDDLTRNIDRNTIPVMGKVWGADAVWKNEFTDEYGTGTAIAESPLKEGLLIVGTDDGLVQISEDASKTWRKVDQFPGVPDMTYVTDVHPSAIDVNTLFVTLNDFQRGNFKPYVMKSTDLGRTWKAITGDLPDGDPAWTIVQDYVNPNLLFVGTEYGLSFTVDGGTHWIKFRNGMPPIPIRDLEIQKRESDLAAASFGRGFFILDDYSALRQLTPQVLQSEGTLFAPGRKARLFSELGYFSRQGENLSSPNPPFGAILSYYLRDDQPAAQGADAPRVVLQVAEANGRIIRQLDAPSRSGLHRVVWDLRELTAQPAPAAGRGANADGAPFGELLPGVEGQEPQAAGRGAAATGRGGRGGGRGGGGTMVKPGTYTVTLGKLVGSNLTPIGEPVKVEVVPLEASNR
jgi:photosystem II stability/assembly factor-like uncharacterized protein